MSYRDLGQAQDETATPEDIWSQLDLATRKQAIDLLSQMAYKYLIAKSESPKQKDAGTSECLEGENVNPTLVQRL